MKVIGGNGRDGGQGNGRDHEDPGAIVDEAVFAVEGDDFEAGQMAALAADFMTAGEGPQTIHQARLQEFLWSALPRKFPEEDWFPMVDGTARLLDKLGLSRYAEIARSDATRAVLEAWADDEQAGFERFVEEHRRSGIAPPDTELIEWGELMGLDEVLAFETVSVALEAAIVDGEHRPGAPGWQAKATEITRRTLNEQVRPVQPADLRRFRMLDLALGSRVESWVASAVHDRHRELRESAAARFMDGPAAIAPAPPPTRQLEAAVAPMAWLLETCCDGVRATDAGYLAPEVVRAAADRFEWWPFDGQPRTEADLMPLVVLHEIAQRNRWVRRRAKRIATTKPALALLDDPVRLWWALVGTAGQVDEYLSMVSELMAMRLLDGPAEHLGPWLDDTFAPSELALFVADVVLAQGWRRGKTPISEQDVDHDVHEPLGEWRLFGFLAERPVSRQSLSEGRPTIALSSTGRQAMLALLHRRATAKREVYFD